ncbi:hypothetical protein F5890DRAFT_1501881 [Lentinula detonsa]|uniref:Uncharacterized protein n=1 Tax=Lentinula detonsa TaxID=2804962 RepID=A0AA38Q3D5_9AGAR|nr:hypothetical protein F5890DRAFT_1501881 [Lentinula detonsa]
MFRLTQKIFVVGPGLTLVTQFRVIVLSYHCSVLSENHPRFYFYNIRHLAFTALYQHQDLTATFYDNRSVMSASWLPQVANLE